MNNNNAINNLPLDFQHPGGFVETTMNYINETAVCPQPIFALGAALSLAGILYGRRVQSEDGQRTNLFAMAIGYTSCGKDHGLKSIARVLDSCSATDLRLGQMTSDSAIEWALVERPRKIALIDEAGYFFNGVSDAKAQGTPQHAIRPALLELWSSANSRWVGKQRVPKDGKTVKPPTTVDCPHLNLYATSQPQILFEGISRNDLRDGWLARNLFFISLTRPKPQIKPMVPVPNAIKAEVFAWKDDDAELVTVPSTPEADLVFRQFGDDIYKKMVAADKSGDETNYLYGKAVENARRIALILAVSRVTGNKAGAHAARLESCDALFATGLVDYLIGDVIRCVDESLSENQDEKNKKRMLRVIAKSGEAGVTRNELTRRTQYIRRKMREEYLSDLIDGGEVVVVPYSDHYGHGERLYLAEFAPYQS